MSRGVKWGLGIGCLTLLLLGGVGLAFAISRIPPVEKQVARAQSGFVVSLREPKPGTSWPLNSSVPVYALVTAGDPIEAAELWVDGGLVASAKPGPGASSGHAPVMWTWQPASLGEHTLVVRARDQRGRVAISGPVNILITGSSAPVLSYEVKPGDTLQGVAQAHGTTPEAIEAANPGAAGVELPPGLRLVIPLPPLLPISVAPPTTPEPPSEPVVPQFDVKLGKLGFWLQGVLGTKDKPPAAPSLTATAEGCSLRLTIVDHATNESGFFVYRSSDAQPALARIATLAPNNGSAPLAFDDPGQWGLVTYAVAAFNAAGEASSNPVSLHVTEPSCAPPETGGDQGQPPVPIEAAGGEQVSPPPSTNLDLAAPAISVAREAKCTVALSILDQSTNEDGFHVYLKRDGQTSFSNEGAYWDRSNPHEGVEPIVIHLDDQHGHVSYYISSYNAGGESPSNVADAYLYDDECAAGRRAWDMDALHQGYLDLDPGVTLAYFYSRAARAHSDAYTSWSRTPADPLAFLPVNGQPFDLWGYLGQTYGPSLVDPLYAYFNADIELWGWAGGQLTPLGTIHPSITPNILLGCPSEDGCQNKPAYGDVTAELTIPAETKVRRREFYWLHDGSAGAGIWQLSRLPFPSGYDLAPAGLLASGSADFRTWIDFAGVDGPCKPLDMSCLLGLVVQASGGNQPYRRLTLPDVAQGGDYYLRVIPASPDPQGKARITNTVVVHLTPASYQPNLPSLGDYYAVEIVDLQQPKLVDPTDWGCVILKQDWTQTVFGNTIVLGKKGEKICPPPIPPKQDCDVWCQAEKIGQGIAEGYDWVAQGIEKLKDMAIGFIADAANEISPGLCSDTCKSVMKTGLNAGITALTGLPPSLPNLKDVANQGLDYAVDYAASQVGADCDDKCKEAFRTALGPLVDQIVPTGSSPSVPGCGDAGLAAQYGKQPMCFTNDMAEPAPGSHYEPAVVLLKVRRGTAAAINVKDGELNYVRLAVGGFNSNTTYASSYFDICQYGVSNQPKSAYYYPEGDLALNYQPNPDRPMTTDEMYATELVPVPWLEPGQEVTIPVVLTPATFRYYSGGVRSKCPSVDDWPYLFYAGVTRMTAQPICLPNAGNMDLQPMGCGQADHKEYDNPIAPETYVAPPQAVPAN